MDKKQYLENLKKRQYLENLKKRQLALQESNIEQPTTPKREVSKLESALRGGAQGLGFSFPDEATAALERLVTGKPYKQALQESRQAYKEAEEANPATYVTGEIIGAIAPAFVTGGLSAPLSLGKLATIGAVEGGLRGLGGSEADLIKEPGALLQDVGIGGTLGAVAPGVGRGITKAMSYAKPTMDVITKKTLTGLTGKTEKFLEELDKNPQAVKRIQEKFGGEIQTEILPELNNKINDFMQRNPYKQRAISGSQKAINAIPEDTLIDKSTGQKVIEKALKDLEDDPFTQTAKDARNILNQYLDNFEKAPDKIEGRKLKTILQNLDSDIEDKFGGYGNPFKNDAATKSIKELRFAWDNELKTKVPEYEKIMRKVRRDTQASTSLTERFATKEGIQPSKIQNFTDRLVREQEKSLKRPDIQKDVRRIESISRLPEEQTGLETLKQDIKDIGLKKAIEARGNQGSNVINPISIAGGILGSGIGSSIGGGYGAGIGGGIGAGLGGIVGRQLEQRGGDISRAGMAFTRGIRSELPTQMRPLTQQAIESTVRASGSPMLNDFLKTQASERDRLKQMQNRGAK